MRQQQREADQRRHNHIHAYISQPLIIAASDSVTTPVSWLIYECSDTVEQRMIARGSNDKRLTKVDTRNSYKVAQYLASREAFLRAFTYALVYGKLWKIYKRVRRHPSVSIPPAGTDTENHP